MCSSCCLPFFSQLLQIIFSGYLPPALMCCLFFLFTGCCTLVTLSSYMMPFHFDDLISIPHLREVSDIRQRVQLLNNIKTAQWIIPADLTNLALFIMNVPEYDGVARTSLLAGCFSLTIGKNTAFFFRSKLSRLRTLNTKCTFFHHSP